jgi:hypothetical protein
MGVEPAECRKKKEDGGSVNCVKHRKNYEMVADN